MAAPRLNHRLAVQALTRHGYSIGAGGRHGTKMVMEGRRPIILPRHGGRDYGKGLTHSILKHAGLKSMEDQAWSSRSSSIGNQRASGRRSTSYRDASRQAER